MRGARLRAAFRARACAQVDSREQMKHSSMWFALALAAGAAQGKDAEPSPLDPKAKAPAAHFRSVLEDYRRFTDQKPADWRQANEEVRKAAQKPAARHGGNHK
jgi:hypothetical protein